MVVYTLEQRWEILWHYFVNHGNVAECMRKLRTDFVRRESPSTAYVRYLAKKVQETGVLINKPKREKPKTVRTPDNIAGVEESVCEAPSTSLHLWIFRRHNWGEFCINTLVWRRTKFNWIRSWSQLNIQCVFADFGKKKEIKISDEADFDFGHVERIFSSHKLKRRILATFGFNRTTLEVPRSRSYTRCFVPCFWRSHYKPQR